VTYERHWISYCAAMETSRFGRLGLLILRVSVDPGQPPFARVTWTSDVTDRWSSKRTVGTREELLLEIQAWLDAMQFPRESPGFGQRGDAG
jgi:hypothetical protein